MSLPHWPQPPKRPTGLGANIADFNSLMSTDPNLGEPHFQAAWADVKAQLVAEGSTEFTGAKLALTDAFNGVLQKGFGITTQDAADAARKFVLIGQTVLGQVGVIENLVAQAQGQLSPLQAVELGQAFVGTMIGIAVAIGPETAGIGAAIVAVIAIAIEVLKASGLLGNTETPAGGWLPNDFGCPQPMTTKPAFTVGGMGAWAPIINPSAANWRSFPSYYSTGNAAWYVFGRKMGVGKWKDGFFGIRQPDANQDYDSNQCNIAGDVRPIDVAFPSYATYVDPDSNGEDPSLVMGLLGIPVNTPTGYEFGYAFISAWKANAEYTLNGLKAQPDEVVLIHLLNIWNHTHAISMASAGVRTTLPPTSQLVNLTKNILSTGDSLYAPNGGLFINLGPRLQPPMVREIYKLRGVTGPTPAGMSTGTKVAATGAAVVGASLVTTAIYAAVIGESVGMVFRHAWKKVFR